MPFQVLPLLLTATTFTAPGEPTLSIDGRPDEPAGDRAGRGGWFRLDLTPSAAWRHQLEVAHSSSSTPTGSPPTRTSCA
jgi:hypothetical protein